STIANISMFKRFLSGIAVIVALTAIGSILAGMLLVVGFFGLYFGLVHHGLDPLIAAVTVSGLALIIVIVLAVWAVIRWYQLREMPRLLYMEQPLIDRAGRLADAFINGLLAVRTRRR